MFSLDFYLRAYSSAINIRPGYTELVRNGEIVHTTSDDAYHTIYQVLDRFFCEKYKFLTRTNISTLADERQILSDLERQGGNAATQFFELHKHVEEHTAYSGKRKAPPIDIATYISRGEHVEQLRSHSAIISPSNIAARKYYFTHCGISVPEDAELEGNKIVLQTNSRWAADQLIDAISDILRQPGSSANVNPELSAHEKEAAKGNLKKKPSYTVAAAVEEVLSKWDKNPREREYKKMVNKGLA